MEQNFAREIGNLVQRLSAEKAELEAELQLKMDQEVMAVRWVATRNETSLLASSRCWTGGSAPAGSVDGCLQLRSL